MYKKSLLTPGRLTLSFDKFLKMYLPFQEQVPVDSPCGRHRTRALGEAGAAGRRVRDPGTSRGVSIASQLSSRKKQPNKTQYIENILNYTLIMGAFYLCKLYRNEVGWKSTHSCCSSHVYKVCGLGWAGHCVMRAADAVCPHDA